MPRARNKKSGQRRGTSGNRGTAANRGTTASHGTAASRGTGASKAPPRPGSAAGQAAQAGPPPGVTPAQDMPPGLTRAGDAPPGLASARTSGPAPVIGLQPGVPAKSPAPRGPAKSPAPRGPAKSPAPRVPAKGAAPRGPARSAAAEPATTPPTTRPEGEQDELPAWAARAAEKLLTVSCWLDPGEHGAPFSATIRFSGRREGVTGKAQPGDTFAQEETVDGIVPGSGPVAITAVVRDVSPGEWTVTARPVARPAGNPFRAYPPPGEDTAARRVPPPRLVTIPADSDARIHTANLLFAKVPGIFRPAYASLISLGVLAGLALEALLLVTGHYTVLRPILFSLAAVAAGWIGGKLWYIAVHRGQQRDGYCIQGFIVGAAVVVVAVALAGAGIPAGVFLSVAAPAVLIGITIGRPGCFWAGCCTGRPTASRWGIWSSDRTLGCRRLPAQLLEALASLVIGAAVLAVVLTLGLARSGPVAVAGLAAYTLARQFIVRLRAEPPQHWRYGRQATTVVAVIALVASAVLLARGTA
jgi:phosphatidylglycerol---prolipoprotein diacylglyceryl transferase